MLEAAAFDLEVALSLHFGSEQPSAELGTSRPAPTFPVSDDSSETSLWPDRAPQEESSWMDSLRQSLHGIGQRLLGIASEDFESWFQERYGLPVPRFCSASYGDAIKEALTGKKFALIWLFQEESVATEHFCRSFLQNRQLLQMLRHSFVLWAGDVNRFEPAQIARLLGIASFPALVAVEPLRNAFDVINGAMFCLEWPLGTFGRPVLRIAPEVPGALLDVDQALAALMVIDEERLQQLRELQENNAVREIQLAEDRRIREEQDREFQESLLADQLAASRKQQAPAGASPADTAARADVRTEQPGPAPAAPTAAPTAAPSELPAFLEEKRKARGAEILANLEPDPSICSVAKLSLRLPSGDRLQRLFRADQTLSEVYEWAHFCRPSAIPEDFELCTSFPVRTLTEKSATLEASGLLPSSALLLKAL